MTLKKRLIAKLELVGECWEFTGATDDGYGRINSNGKAIQTHRLSYELWKGIIPKDKHVLHRCDNPPCCNPNHLFLGTAKTNAIDRMKKSRGYPSRKLSYDDVEFIRLCKDDYPQRYFAKKFGVSQCAIQRVQQGKTYAEVA